MKTSLEKPISVECINTVKNLSLSCCLIKLDL